MSNLPVAEVAFPPALLPSKEASSVTGEIPLFGTWGKGKVTLVDDCDYDWLSEYRWIVHNVKGAGRLYVVRCHYLGARKTKQIYMHRAVLGITAGLCL